MHKVKKGFYVGAFLAGNLGHWIIWAITTALIIAYPEKRPILQMLMMPASWLTILSAVVAFILIYKMWAAIQGMGARTSAGKALGFMFIPFFNLYWHFEVYWGWTKDYNRIAERDDVELPSMPEGIGLAVCILPLLCICLMVAGIVVGGWKSIGAGSAGNVGLQAPMLVSLVNIVLMAVLFSRICDGINALVDAGLEPQQPQYALPREDAKTSGLAITSLILGICGFCSFGLTGIVGLILGIIAISTISNSYGRLKGRGLAVSGIVVSAVSLFMLFTAILMAVLMPALSSARGQASGGGDAMSVISDDEMIWVKCNNPACKVEYQMGKKAYFKYMEENIDPRAESAPPLICKKCGKPSAYRAEKCGNSECGIIFFRGIVPNDLADRCPECSYSTTEESRKRNLAGPGQ